MKCGFYQREITPPLGVDMPGYYTERLSTGVKDRLYAKAAVFANSDDPADKAAIVVVDTVLLTEEFCRPIAERASRFTGIPAENVTVAVTHTHRGLPTGDYTSVRDQQTMDVLVQMIADCITLADQRLQEGCTVHYAKGKVEGISHVRDYRMTNGDVSTNARYPEEIEAPLSEPDPDLPLLLVKDSKGRPLGGLYTYALHLDCIGGLEHSGDYPARLAEHFRRLYGQNFVCIYLAGFCGDINHVDCITKTAVDFERIVRKLTAELTFLADHAQPMEGPVKAASATLQIPRRWATEEELKRAEWVLEDPQNRKNRYHMLKKTEELMLEFHRLHPDRPAYQEIPVRVVRVGEVYLFALPGEIYHCFGDLLKAGCPGGKWLITELANAEAGYIPDPALFNTSAYPVQLCHGSFLVPEAGQMMVDAALKLAEKLK